jgi:hypothetical protein
MIDSETGTVLQTINGAWTQFMSDMAFDYSTNTMYGTKANSANTAALLFTVNLATGVPTQVAQISGITESFLIAMAIDLDGNMYGIGVNPSTNANFYLIDKSTGAASLIGSTGRLANYAQCMNFDHNDGTLYWCQLSSVSDMNFTKVNVTTGAATVVAATGKETMCFHVPYNPGDPPETKYNVYRDDVKIAGPIEETTFDDTTFDPTQAYKWSGAVVCKMGGEGEWVGVEEEACDKTPPEPCDPITGGTAEIGCDEAVLTWTAVADAVGYKVSDKDGNFIVSVTEATYTEAGTFKGGDTYTWKIETVCASDVSVQVEVSGVAVCESINELSNSVAIYPNPSNGMVTITAKDFAKVEIYNTVGQLVETRTVNTVDVSSYNTGIYFFKVYDSNNNSVTKRVMVTK